MIYLVLILVLANFILTTFLALNFVKFVDIFYQHQQPEEQPKTEEKKEENLLDLN